MGAVAHLETRSIPVTPGAEGAAVIRVRNSGTVVDQFAIDVLGDAAAWSTSEPATLSLFPGAEETARVVFRPPRSPQVPAGELPFGIRVRSKEDPAGSVVEEGTLEIAPFNDTFAEIAPRTSRGNRGGSHDLAIDNRGNARLNATLTAADPDKLLQFDISPPGVVADPGTAAFAKVRVRSRETFWRGAPKTRPFKLSLESPGAQPLGIEGTLLQEAMLPPWFLKALLGLLALLVGLLLLWLFFLQPAIESTARQRADEAVVARLGPSPPGQTPFPLATSGGGSPTPPPTASSGASASPGTSGSPSPSAPSSTASAPLSGDTVAVADRILAGNASVAVPDGKTMFVTDLVFSHASDAAVGTMTLSRNDIVLFQLRLENFRDLDYHFVTPIVVQTGESLRLACDTECASGAVFYSGYQR